MDHWSETKKISTSFLLHRCTVAALIQVAISLIHYRITRKRCAKQRGRKRRLIDLNAMSKMLYETWGPDGSLKAFVHYPANTFPNQKEELKDNTHFNPYGAYELTECIVSSIRKQNLPLAKFIKKEIRDFDPSKPMTAWQVLLAAESAYEFD